MTHFRQGTRSLLICWTMAGGLVTPSWGAPRYEEHQDLSYYLDDQGQRHPVQSRHDWELRRQHILAHLQAVMGELPDRASVAKPSFESLQDEVVKNLRRRKIRYPSAAPGEWITAWLLEPAEKRGSSGAILCLHQTVAIGKDEPVGLGGRASLHYALHLAQRGYVTLSPDYPSLGESTHDFSADSYPSGTLKAIVDNLQSIDLLGSLASVDPERIGCIGHSLGGHNGLFTAVFDPRIQVVITCCGFTRMHKYYGGDLRNWAGPRYMPRIATRFASDPDQLPFDFTEIVAALAPRPVLAIAPLNDNNFEVSGVRDVMAAARPIYELLGHPKHLQADYPDCGHDFPESSRELAYRFLDEHLGTPPAAHDH
jgi:dienelactone hydrolase